MTKNTLTTLIFLLLTLPFHGNSQNNDPNQEKSILLRLKQFWSDPTPLTHWTTSSDHCTWPEVTCTNGSVTELQIMNTNITGTIPPFLCDLNNLVYIDFQYNYFSGNFPTVLYNCSKLQHLDLSQNVLVGTLPDDINRLSPRLEFLNLEANNFSGDIPSAIGSFPNLKTLQLSFNLFDGSFPQEIGNLLNLEELILSENGFKPQSIPSTFTQLTKLRNFFMPNMNLIGKIPDGIGNMSALEFLDLSTNGLDGNIPPGLFLLKNLTSLYLYKNRLSGSIPQVIEAVQLRVLDLSNNSLTGTIPEAFENLTSLTGLALFFNQLSGPLPVGIGRLPGLVDFGIWSNNLSGELPPDFGRYSNLKTFQVCSNQFVGELPRHLCNNKALVGLIAFENNLTGELPDSLGDCDSLEIIRVHDNSLSGRIPDGLWTGVNLTTLMISNNLFTGQIPDKVGPQLSLVELMNNRFSGPIPPGISSWENLSVFRASNNLLNGSIPQELTSLSFLSSLLLDRNQFSGLLPSNIISWKSLTFLNLSRNRLSGEIPPTLGLLPDLVYLDLSENEFSGPIPPEIGIRRFSSLDLSSNRLSGRIPGQLENAAFDNSFLNNPGLCSDNPSLGLSSCRVRETRTSKKLSSRFIAAVSSISAVVLLAAVLYAIYLRKHYRKRRQVLDSSWKLTSFQRLNFTDSSILSSLTQENLIGSGGSGTVYRVAVNRSGECVAVKKIFDNMKLEQKLEKEFRAEVQILGTVRHSNIVKLLCCFSSENTKLLVYEYMENNSLDRWLHGRWRKSDVANRVVLDWPKRLQIAIGAAKGLCYLHHDCSPPIIHRDVKSSNVLLDSEFNAKIADFGLARMMIRHGEPNTLSMVAGSFGYMAPEYANSRRVTEKIDVYSFGVVLLELIIGREAQNGDENSSLAEWAWRYLQEGKAVVDAFDKDIKQPQYMDEMSSVFKLGVICTNRYPSSRPSMKDVLQILLRSSRGLKTLSEKIGRNENDVAPLLYSSNTDKTLGSDDTAFVSII